MGITASASKSAFLSASFSSRTLFSRLGGFRRNRRRSAPPAGGNEVGAAAKNQLQREPVNPLSSPKNKNGNQAEPTKPKPEESPRAKEGVDTNVPATARPTPVISQNGSGQASIFVTSDQPARLGVLNQPSSGIRQVITPRHISISGLFTDEELNTLHVELLFNQAATARQLRELSSGASRGFDFKEPRAADHLRSDKKNYDFLIGTLRTAKYGRGIDNRGVGYIDTSSLSNEDLVDLYEFSRFETDRLARQTDHLAQDLSHVKGPTADYIIGKHRVEARFYHHLASQLEPLITTEMQDDYWGWGKP